MNQADILHMPSQMITTALRGNALKSHRFLEPMRPLCPEGPLGDPWSLLPCLCFAPSKGTEPCVNRFLHPNPLFPVPCSFLLLHFLRPRRPQQSLPLLFLVSNMLTVPAPPPWPSVLSTLCCNFPLLWDSVSSVRRGRR